MKKQQFDRLVSEIREENVSDDALRQAATRVMANISTSGPAEDVGQRLRSCGDFQALIPAHIIGHLAPARAMLMEDHLHQCVACRHALQAARQQNPVAEPRRTTQVNRFPVLRLALAGALAVGIAIGLLAGNAGLLPGQHMSRATIESIDGSLFLVANDSGRFISAGYKLSDGDEFRTTKGSRAELRLADGSQLEVDERSQLSISRGWRGTTIHLDGGDIIVQDSHRRTGHLYVSTDDCLVSSKGTVFLVSHGTKGSRVSVIQGVVNVAYGNRSEELQAGAQATSTGNVSKVPIQDEVAWSKDAAKYMALLGEFRLLERQWEAIPGPGLRYQSNLLQYVPDNSVVFAAIPNLGSTLSDADRVFEERLQQSPALREWWKQQPGSHDRALRDMISKVETFSGYLGGEVVLTIGRKNNQAYTAPVLLAEVRKAGLPGFLQQQNRELSGGDQHRVFRILDNPAVEQSSSDTPWFVYFTNNLMVASIDLDELRRVAALIEQPPTSRANEKPFRRKIAQAYRDGAGWLFCVDMEQILSNYVHNPRNREPLPPGFDNVKYLTLERRDVGKTETRAAITFATQRTGIAAWLAEPAPMGSLDFVSPEASLAASFVIKDPKILVDEMFQFAESSDPNFRERLAELESNLGVSVRDDISAPLGGEVTFAIDGPLLPVPSWKVIVEVYDRDTLEATILKLVDSFNRQAGADKGRLQLSQRQLGSQTYCTLHNDKHPDFELDYAFVDSYLILGPSQSLLARAIQNRQAGYTLTRSQGFQAQLPTDGYTNFSAILYHNIASALTPLTEQLKTLGNLTPDEQKELDALKANAAPGLIYAYGEPDRIVVASSTGFMGLNLDSFLAISEGKPILLSQVLGANASTWHERARGGGNVQ
jgi:hypothetical protein